MWFQALLLAVTSSWANDGPDLVCDSSLYIDIAFNDAGELEDDDCSSYITTCNQPLTSNPEIC